MNTATLGSMSHAEWDFCSQIRDIFRATLDGRTPFCIMALSLLEDLRTIVRRDWDVRAATAVGRCLATVGAVHTRQSPTGTETSFLEDADGFVDFALRNGLTFDTVASVLMHDLSEIAIHEFKLDTAIADGCLLPQVTGWAKRNQDSPADADEPLE